MAEIGTLFTPDTILRWHRLLVARKWDYSKNRKPTGRPRVDQEIVELVLRFARENPGWGYDRIQGALANLGHSVSDQSIGNILKEHGIEPAPKRTRQSSWKTFIKSHWDVTFYLLFVPSIAFFDGRDASFEFFDQTPKVTMIFVCL